MCLPVFTILSFKMHLSTFSSFYLNCLICCLIALQFIRANSFITHKPLFTFQHQNWCDVNALCEHE